jgi:hypothetical protein
MPLDTENIAFQDALLTAEAKHIQQEAVRQTKSSNEIQTAINDRYNSFISAQQLSVEVLELYRRQRKLMWIYLALMVALLGGLAYMYYTTFDRSVSIFSEEGRKQTSSNLSGLSIFNKSGLSIFNKSGPAVGKTETAAAAE